jgi:purine-binding chemotaxis protein CheW
MDHEGRFIVFLLAGQRYALPLAAVDKVVRAVEYTVLPKAPDIVLGIINVQGRVIPLVNIRRRFRLPEREVALTDQIVIAHTARRPVALLMDGVSGMLENPEQEIVPARDILPDTDYIDGVVKLKDGLVLIHNLDRFLSMEEATALDQALEEG